MIETVCAKFRKQNHPNNTLLLTWAAFLSHFRPILHDLALQPYKPSKCRAKTSALSSAVEAEDPSINFMRIGAGRLFNSNPRFNVLTASQATLDPVAPHTPSLTRSVCI